MNLAGIPYRIKGSLLWDSIAQSGSFVKLFFDIFRFFLFFTKNRVIFWYFLTYRGNMRPNFGYMPIDIEICFFDVARQKKCEYSLKNVNFV